MGFAVFAGLAALIVSQRCRDGLPGVPATQRLSKAAYAQYPRQYIAPRGTISDIDGDVFKKEWEELPWSEEFLEIRGSDAPAGTSPTSGQATRIKMMWDDKFLYVAAVMDLVEDQELIAKFTKRNSPIFHTDVDFEVFIDPAGCNHGYKELELNAINTVWNLMLDKPYMDGGNEHSGREHKEGDKMFWEVKGQRTATRVLKGALHDASKSSRWSVELALAHSDTVSFLPFPVEMPKVGGSWRINFSRVEDKGNTNWVWTPQAIWDTEKQRYEGKVNMHLPDAWGYVVFADGEGRLSSESAENWRDPSWPVRLGAMNLYYAARAFHDKMPKPKRFPSSLSEIYLNRLVDRNVLNTLDVAFDAPDPLKGYSAVVTGGGWKAVINQERLLRVYRS